MLLDDENVRQFMAMRTGELINPTTHDWSTSKSHVRKKYDAMIAQLRACDGCLIKEKDGTPTGDTFLTAFLYRNGDEEQFSGRALAIYMSVDAPILAYGPVDIFWSTRAAGSSFINPAEVGSLPDESWRNVEQLLLDAAREENITLMTRSDAMRTLPCPWPGTYESNISDEPIVFYAVFNNIY